MKVIWEFDPEIVDDNVRIKLYQQAQGMHGVLWDFAQFLRQKLKYGDYLSESDRSILEEVRKEFVDLLDEHKIDLDE